MKAMPPRNSYLRQAGYVYPVFVCLSIYKITPKVVDELCRFFEWCGVWLHWL